MGTKIGVGAIVLLVTVNQAFAGFFPTPPVPEFDASSGIAAVGLLASVGAILLSKFRN
jgi:hypothetical protein